MVKALVIVLIALIAITPFCFHAKQFNAQGIEPFKFSESIKQKKISRSIILDSPEEPAHILNCNAVQLDSDVNDELIVCDHDKSSVLRCDYADGEWHTQTIANDILGPCHSHVADLDGDGDLDIAVASLGSLLPNDSKVGAVFILENTGDSYEKIRLPYHLRRVSDVRSADFDKDGDRDLVIVEFGHYHGSVIYCENIGKFEYRKSIIHEAPGGIHAPIADFDNDGDMDVAVCISQNDESVYVFENNGFGQFKKRMIFDSINFDLGISGMVSNDIDKDGDVDIIMSCGDNLESPFHYVQPHHGCYILENLGDLKFSYKKLFDVPGCYAVDVGDIDRDGDTDVVAVSMINDWESAGSYSVYWAEQTDDKKFIVWGLVKTPIQMVTCVIGDFTDRAGNKQIVTGVMHMFPPFEKYGSVDCWSVIDE